MCSARSVWPVVSVFQLTGLFPLTGRFGNAYRRFAVAFQAALVALSIVVLAAILERFSGLPEVSVFNYFGLFCGYVLTVLAGIVAISFITFHSHDVIRFFDQLENIDRDLQFQNPQSKNKFWSILQFLFIIIPWVLAFPFLYSKTKDIPLLLSFIPPSLPINILRLIEISIEQMLVTMLLLLRQRFSHIKLKLEGISSKIEDGRSFFRFPCCALASPGVQCGELASLRRCHSRLEGLVGELNAAFDLPLLCSTASLFAALVGFSFFALHTAVLGNHRRIVHSPFYLFFFLNLLARLLLLVGTCGATSKQAGSARGALSQLMTQVPPQHPSFAELRLFSEQLVHNASAISACDFFTVDNSLLITMLGSATTYVVLLLQFGTVEET